jgi:tetraacyldisaccharide 4'-kinase
MFQSLFLFPLSWIYGIGVWIRNTCFDLGLLKSQPFPIPVICIGNLSMGGTGKTPHTEYLIRLLQDHGLHVAVLSRGYKRKSKGYLLATPESHADLIGDEPYQMKQKFPQARIAVDANRRRGICKLMELNNPPVDVILLDDAFQHRYVRAGLNILLTPSNRPFFADHLLPAGQLREPPYCAERADIIIATKSPQLPDFDKRCPHLVRKLTIRPGQTIYCSTFEYEALTPLFGGEPRALDTLAPTDSVMVLTGIAAPQPLFAELKRYIPAFDTVRFADHHHFTDKELREIRRRFNHTLLITTEKDAARLKNNPALDNSLKPYIYTLPIKVVFLHAQQQHFNNQIIDYVTDNSRNGNVPKE